MTIASFEDSEEGMSANTCEKMSGIHFVQQHAVGMSILYHEGQLSRTRLQDLRQMIRQIKIDTIDIVFWQMVVTCSGRGQFVFQDACQFVQQSLTVKELGQIQESQSVLWRDFKGFMAIHVI